MNLRLSNVLLAAAGASAVATAAVATTARVDFGYERPALHVALETAAALVALVATYLALGRFRRRARVDDLLLFVALGTLAVSNLFFAALPAASTADPSRFSTWASLGGQLLGALGLAAAAFAPPDRIARPDVALHRAVVGGCAAIGAMAAVVALLTPALPVGVETDAAAEGTLDGHPVVLGLQLVMMVAFAAASVGFARRAERLDDSLLRWLALGALLGAFARLNYFLSPSLYANWVYTGDVFRLLFYTVLLVGAAREVRGYWRRLAHTAVLEERRRIARDLHDGVAQELAFIVRRARRVRAPEDATPIAAAAERALEDSRRAIVALTREEDESLDSALAEATEQVAGRFGVPLALDLAEDVRVRPDVREALVRIACEAVGNAARHGEPRHVRVELDAAPNVRLRVADDGKGFDPAAPPPSPRGGFGLVSMRERAAGLGAAFDVRSRPGHGTEVEVILP